MLRRDVARPSHREIFLRTSFTDRNLSAVSQAGLVNNLNDGMVWGLFPLFHASAGLSLNRLPCWPPCTRPSGASRQLFTGALSDRVGRKWLIASGMWVQAAGIGAFVLWPQLAGFVAGAVLLGAGTAMVYPTLLATIGDVVQPAVARFGGRCLPALAGSGLRGGRSGVGCGGGPLGVPFAIALVAAVTFASGLVVAVRLAETHRR